MGEGWRRLRPSVDRCKCRRGIELKKTSSGMPTLLGDGEGHTDHCAIARSEPVPRSLRLAARMDVFCADPKEVEAVDNRMPPAEKGVRP